MRLNARLAFATVALAMVVWIPTGYAEPEMGWNLESRVPASTLAILSMEDVGGWEARLEKTAIVQLFKDPEVKAFTDPLIEDVESMLSSEDLNGPLQELPPFVWELFEQLQGLQGQLAVALLDMDFDTEMPTLVASLDFGDKVEDFVTFLSRLKAELGEDGEAIQTFDRDGRTWWQVDTGGPVISATTVDTAFVIATDPQSLQSVLAGPMENGLGTTEAYKACRAKTGGDDLGMFLYGNVPHLMEVFGDQMPPDAMGIANALGLDTVKGAAYGMAFVGDGFMDSIVVHTPGAEHGITALDLTAPLRPRALAMVPANAFYYTEAVVKMDEVMPKVKDLIARVDADAASEVDGAINHVNQMLGIDVETELMANMGDRVAAYASMPETGGLYPEFALMMSVKDPASFEGIFERFVQGIAGAVTEEGDVIASTRKIEYRGKTLHLFEMQAARGDDPVPFTPTWTLKDDWLIVTLVPYSMKEIILRTDVETVQTGGSGGLAAQEDFQSLMAVKPAEASSMEYLDMQAIMTLLYDTGVPLLQTLVKPNMMPIPLRLDWAQLPPARSVHKYFRSFASFGTLNRDGLSIQMHGPIPMVGVAAVSAAVFAGVFLSYSAGSAAEIQFEDMPGVIEVTPSDMDAELAMVQAQELLRYVRLYELENKRLPKSLQELVDANVMRQIQKDPWGNDFLLLFDAPAPGESKSKARIASGGPDGKMGTEDDIVAGGN